MGDSGISNYTQLASPLEIGAGETDYFEVVANISNVQNGSSVTATLTGDEGPVPLAPFATIEIDGFAWSPDSTTASSFSDADWTDSYNIGIPTSGIAQTLTNGQSTSITITSPVGGTSWISGASQRIDWNANVTSGNVAAYINGGPYNTDSCRIGEVAVSSGTMTVTPTIDQSCPNLNGTLSAGPNHLFLLYPFVSNDNPGTEGGQSIPITLVAGAGGLTVAPAQQPPNSLAFQGAIIPFTRFTLSNVGTTPITVSNLAVELSGGVPAVFKDVSVWSAPGSSAGGGGTKLGDAVIDTDDEAYPSGEHRLAGWGEAVKT